MRRYRRKLKTTAPETYEERKKRDRERKKNARVKKREILKKDKTLLVEARAKKAAEMRKYRERQRQTEPKTKRSQAMESTRKAQKEKKEKQERDRHSYIMHKEKLKRKQAVMRTQAWRMRIKMKKSTVAEQQQQQHPEPQASTSSTPTPYTNRWSKNRAVRRVRQSLPKTPEKRAFLVEELASSPSCKDILSKKGAYINPTARKTLDMGRSIIDGFQKKLSEVKYTGGGHNEKRQAYHNLKQVVQGLRIKYGLKSKICKEVDIKNKKQVERQDWWKLVLRKKRKDCIPNTVRNSIQYFYMDPEISKELPCARVAKENVEKRIMTMTIGEAFKLYKEKHPDHKLGLTSFRKFKPRNICIVSETNRRSCLCQVCCNVALKSKALKSFVRKQPGLSHLHHLVKMSKRETAQLTLCEVPAGCDPKPECLNRQCVRCGRGKIRDHFKDIRNGHEDTEIEWYEWGYIKVLRNGNERNIVSCLP